jgi:hypothetical protein
MNISDVDANTIDLQADGATRLVDTALYEINLLIEKKKQIKKENDDCECEITAWFFLLTDGDDNMSHQPARKLHQAIDIAKKEYNIQCIFLGANQDAIKTGATLGFNADQSLTFGGEAGNDPDNMPVLSAMRCVSQNLTQMEENDANTVPAFTHLQRHSSAPDRVEGNLDNMSYPPMTEHGRLPMLRRANAQELDDIDEYDLAPPSGLTRAVAQELNDNDDVDDGFSLTPPTLQRS